MKPSEIKEAVKCCILAHQPFMVWGHPGIGKSSIIQQVADELYCGDYGYHVAEDGRPRNDTTGTFLNPWNQRPWFIDFRAVLRDVTDLMGFPKVDEKTRKTYWAPPAMLPTKGRGLFFCDEINRAVPLVQNGCLQLVQDRAIGEYHLPDEWAVGAAGNYESETGVYKMSDALCSRFSHIDAEVDAVEWDGWAVQHGLHAAVIAYVRWRPANLHIYDPKGTKKLEDKRAFPCPRTYEFVSKILYQKAVAGVTYGLIKGTIGQAVADEFVSFLKIYNDLPDVEQIEKDPNGARVPTQPAALYAVGMALARRASTKTIRNVMTYLERIPEQEYVAMTLRDMKTRDPNLMATMAVTRWMTSHPQVVI